MPQIFKHPPQTGSVGPTLIIISYDYTISVNANLAKNGDKLRDFGQWMASTVFAYWSGELFF
jgi:hypothetical protein